MMNEAILRPVFGSDESKTLGIVEPLDGSGGTHTGTSSVLMFVGSPVLPYPPTFVLTRQTEKRPGLSRSPCVFTGSSVHTPVCDRHEGYPRNGGLSIKRAQRYRR